MMGIDWFYIAYTIRSWGVREDGVALLEAAMLFPPMLTLLLGVFDLGNGIILSQKTITASQIAADLVSRSRTMNTTDLSDIIEGAKLPFQPFALVDFGIDIVSIEFDENQEPSILWRHTENMSPNLAAVESVSGMSEEGEGIIIVTVKYTYIPKFASFFTGNMDFSETAFTRGRRSATVVWE